MLRLSKYQGLPSSSLTSTYAKSFEIAAKGQDCGREMERFKNSELVA